MKTSKNTIFSIISYVTSLTSTLLLVPLIQKTMGIEAFGYVAVATSLVSITSIVSMALTPMTTRFISVSLIRGDVKTANMYFNSSLVGCGCIAVLVVVGAVVTISNIESLVKVSPEYVTQLQALLAILAASFCCILISVPFSAGLYAKNEIHIYYMFSAASQIGRILVAYLLFKLYAPMFWEPYLGSLVIDFLALIYYVKKRKGNLPGLTLNLKFFGVKPVLEILRSGIWFSVSRAGNVLLLSISSYIANLVFGAALVGIFASISQIQQVLLVLSTTLAGSFGPVILQAIAKDDLVRASSISRRTIRYLGIFIGVITGIVLVYGDEFFTLWLGIDLGAYQFVLILMVIFLPFTCPVEIVAQIFSAANRVRFPALVTIVCGVLNIVLVIVFCVILKFGLAGLAFAQLISLTVKAVCVFLPYGAWILNEKYWRLLRVLFVAPAATGVSTLSSYFVRLCIIPNSWIALFASGLLCLSVSIFIVGMIFTKKNERMELYRLLSRQ